MVQDLMVAVARVRDTFHRAVYVDRDVAAALAQVSDDCTLVHLPSGTGATGRAGLSQFLELDVLPHLPDDLAFRRLSRTVDRWHVAEESLVSFTHDRELPWLLPGRAPTHRPAEVLAVSVVTVMRSVITSHRTLWDLHSLTKQLSTTPRS
jgi:carboxymethylenebutenolidase